MEGLRSTVHDVPDSRAHEYHILVDPRPTTPNGVLIRENKVYHVLHLMSHMVNFVFALVSRPFGVVGRGSTSIWYSWALLSGISWTVDLNLSV